MAETDNEQEWMPSPTQRNRTMPWAVDAAFYETWEQVVPELVALVEGREALSVAEFAQVGAHRWADPPQGFIDVGLLLTDPGPIVVPVGSMFEVDTSQRLPVEKLLRDLFGGAYRE